MHMSVFRRDLLGTWENPAAEAINYHKIGKNPECTQNLSANHALSSAVTSGGRFMQPEEVQESHPIRQRSGPLGQNMSAGHCVTR